MNVYYLFNKPPTTEMPYRKYLSELMSEAKPLEETEKAGLKKTPKT